MSKTRFRPWSFWAPLLVLVAAGAGAEIHGNFPLPPQEAMALFASGDFRIVEGKRTESGVAGAQKWLLELPDGRRLKAKWKGTPPWVPEGWNNSPRREILAYEIQKWILDEKDYVVPPVEIRCIPLSVYRELDPKAHESLRGTGCVLGALSLWIQDIEVPRHIWHPDLFESDPDYRYSLAASNVIAYLIEHRDGRRGNFVWSTKGGKHVFAIDNGISMDAFPPNVFVGNWNVIRVPALPREVVRRLEQVTPAQIQGLAVMRTLKADANGVLRPVAPLPDLDPTSGARFQGDTLQIGLSAEEVGEVQRRFDALLARLKAGEIPVF